MISIMLGDEQKTILPEPKDPLSVESSVANPPDTNAASKQRNSFELQRGGGPGVIGPRTADMGVLKVAG